MTNHLNPVAPAGIYVERQDNGGYSFEMVSNGGMAVTVTLPRINGPLLGFAYDACMSELMRAYGKLAIASDARTPGKIIVPR
jgi:hypothetical protein